MRAPVHRAIVPRDAIRLGLPVGVLVAARPDGDASRALLLLVAACLFAVAAGGSTILGAAARSVARQA